jgi:1-aminocyclopropane-1-carboxylate deaminase/D-cysteine desulfhydrase-like pyridoxal-dependent ACC family enzyme
VLGVSMANVALLRLDKTGGPAPGNKFFKLNGYVASARQQGIHSLVSFGGAWSNHLHALAAAGHQYGFKTLGIVRGEAPDEESAMLQDVRRWGMRLEYVSRSRYRLRNTVEYQQEIAQRFAPCLVIPEGGATAIGASGCSALADMIKRVASPATRIVVPVGTGTTLAGLVSCLDGGYEIVGISALKGATDLEHRVDTLLTELGVREHAHWRILHDYHCGGFARVSGALREFILTFEAVQGIPLEPVYTGKMLFAIHQLLRCGEWDPAVPVIALHTGGLQGRRGYSWLDR